MAMASQGLFRQNLASGTPLPTRLVATRKAERLVVYARGYNNSGSSRIIIPGGGSDRSPRDRQSSRIVLPGQDRPGSKGASIDTAGVPTPSTTQFRPPPGFMDSETTLETAQPLDPVQARSALDRLRSSIGAWHELALLLPPLSAAGYDSTVVELETGLERKSQNVWAVAAQVYKSLEKSGAVSMDNLAYFGSDPSGADMLYHLRFLPVNTRPAVAQYMAAEQMNASEAGVLARAVKEQERRDGVQEGFTTSPADCLAYKYYRDAIESRVDHQRAQLIQKGLSVAETETARAALEKLVSGEEKAATGITDIEQANLEIIRLTGEEVEFRPVALVGEMAETSASAVASASGFQQSGIYNAFTVSAENVGQQIVALPAFRSLLLARSPVALSIRECAELPAVLKAAKATSKEDIRRQSGPGLILLDRNLEGSEHNEKAFYIREQGGVCELIEGNQLADSSSTLGRVLFLCRPPVRNAAAKLDSYALMSV